MNDDRGDRRLDAIEDPGNHRNVAELDIDPRQPDQDEQRRQHEQPASNHPAPGPVHQPTDVGRELLGLGPGQQHAVVQGMQKALLADPAATLHQLLVEDGDLSCRPAKADEADLQPEQQRFEQAHRGRWLEGGFARGQRRRFSHDRFPRWQRPPAARRRCRLPVMLSRRPARTRSMPDASAGWLPPTSR